MATAPASEDGKPKKPPKAYATVLVTIPGWPSADPNRPMIHSVRPSPYKAKKAIKRLEKLMPQYVWSYEMLTATEAREIKLKPFRMQDAWLAKPIEVRFTGRSVKVVELAE